MIDPAVLESFILDHGLSHKKNSVSFILECPRCLKKDKLYIRRKDGRFICFVCAETENFRGRAEYALSELCSQPLWQTIEELYGESQDVPESGRLELDLDFGESLDEDTVLESDIPIPTMQYPLDFYPIGYSPKAKRGLDYLESRGITKEIAMEYDLRYHPQDRRVVFPIKINGKLVGWQKRLIIENKTWDEENGKWLETPKILSSVGIPRDRTLMFADSLKNSPHAIICEGPIDALACARLGGAVAAMGKVISKGQIDLILASGVKKVYLALDPDAAAETKKLLSTLSDLECFLLEPPSGKKDMGECTKEEINHAFLNAPLLNPGHLFIFFNRK
jgi:DNA primase